MWKKMKRNTLFLLSYSIIIPLTSSAFTFKPDLTSISLGQYQTRCEKFSNYNFSEVQDYVKNCKDSDSNVKSFSEVAKLLCFGVVNNILLACDKAAVNVLQFMNDTENKKNVGVNVNLSICPLEVLEVEQYLESNEHFFNLSNILKNETLCKEACYDFSKNPLEQCFLWYKTKKLLQEFENQSGGKLSNQQASDATSHGSDNKTVIESEKTGSLPKVAKNNPASVKDDSRPVVNIPPQASKLEINLTNSDKNSGGKEAEPKDAKQPNLPTETEDKTQAEKTKVGKKPTPVKDPELNTGNHKPLPSKTISNYNQDPSPQAPADPNVPEPPGNSDDGRDSSPGESTSDVPGVGDDYVVDSKYPAPGEDADNPQPEEHPENQQLDTPEKPKDADPETSLSKSVSSNDISYSDSIVEEDSHFYVYFFTSASIVILGYVAFHNKNKILAYALEGRRSRNGRRRPNSASYRKLECSLEEAITSNSSHANVTNVVY